MTDYSTVNTRVHVKRVGANERNRSETEILRKLWKPQRIRLPWSTVLRKTPIRRQKPSSQHALVLRRMEPRKPRMLLHQRSHKKQQETSNHYATTLRLLQRTFLDSKHQKPGGAVVKHSGLWTHRREFESLPGYHCLSDNSYFFEADFHGFP